MIIIKPAEIRHVIGSEGFEFVMLVYATVMVPATGFLTACCRHSEIFR
jgi:hypothetical protein